MKDLGGKATTPMLLEFLMPIPMTYVFFMKSACEHKEASDKVIKNVHSILKYLDIHVYHCNGELNELRENISELVKSLRWNKLKVSNLNDNFSS